MACELLAIAFATSHILFESVEDFAAEAAAASAPVAPVNPTPGELLGMGKREKKKRVIQIDGHDVIAWSNEDQSASNELRNAGKPVAEKTGKSGDDWNKLMNTVMQLRKVCHLREFLSEC